MKSNSLDKTGYLPFLVFSIVSVFFEPVLKTIFLTIGIILYIAAMLYHKTEVKLDVTVGMVFLAIGIIFQLLGKLNFASKASIWFFALMLIAGVRQGINLYRQKYHSGHN